MFINLYIARPTYRFILIYTCGLTAVIKRICYMLYMLYVRWSFNDGIVLNNRPSRASATGERSFKEPSKA